MISAFQNVLSIFIMIFLGFFLAKKVFFTDELAEQFVKIVFNISLPLQMLAGVCENFTKNMLLESSKGILLALISLSINYIIGIILLGGFCKNRKGRSLYEAFFTFPNTIFLGLPVCVSVLGRQALPYVLIYNFASTILFWTISIYKIRKEANASDSHENPIKKIISPPLLGFLIGIMLLLLNIKVPTFILNTFNYIGNITTPLSMFVIGIMLSDIDIINHQFNLFHIIILIGKFILLPVITITLLNHVDISTMLRNTFILESAMPSMSQIAMVAKQYSLEESEASFVVGLSTLLSLIVIPLYVSILI